MQYKSGSYVAAVGGVGETIIKMSHSACYVWDGKRVGMSWKAEKVDMKMKMKEKDKGCELWDSEEEKFRKVCSH